MRKSLSNLILTLFFLASAGMPSFAGNVQVSNLTQLQAASLIQDVTIEVVSNIDMKGEKIPLPKGCMLRLAGTLSNGTIVGNHTGIQSDKAGVFKHVTFQGSFSGRPDIAWFSIEYGRVLDNAPELNSALQLTALCTDKVLTLPAEKTVYVRSDTDHSSWRDFLRTGTVEIRSGVTFDLNGSTIRCLSNGSHQYNILFSRDAQDIVIRNGSIRGDLAAHTGSRGEWGYGIALQGVKNFVLEDLECFECWGDGIDIQVSSDGDGNEQSAVTRAGHCRNGIIRNVYCHDNRRQGMSVQGILDLLVINSRFARSKGTDPQSGVDIEPYSENNIVAHVVFEGCRFEENAHSGLILSGKSIYDVKVEDCIVCNNRGWDISVQGRNIQVLNCKSVKGQKNPGVRIVGDCENLIIRDCDLKSVYAQGFQPGHSVKNVIVENCRFSWDGESVSSGFSDDKSLAGCDISFEGCVFDFYTGRFSDGNMIYQSDNPGYRYSYKKCTFNCGGEPARITNSQLFDRCVFNDCKNMFVITSPSAENRISLKRCTVKGTSSESFVNVYSPVDNAAVSADFRGTTFSGETGASNPVIITAPRRIKVTVENVKRKYRKKMASRQCDVQYK